jgi:2-polyprenyl-6-methoxyphenol hydroxylase-like FAD-dependent oxidoreductase
MELYRHLGVLDDIQAASLPIPLARKYGPDGKEVIQEWHFVETYTPTPDCPYVSASYCGGSKGHLHVGQLAPFSLDQDAMERILRDSLRRRFGVVVELGTELVNFEQSKDHVVVHLRKHLTDGDAFEEETVHAQYLVGTDGGRSTVRKQLGLTFLGETRAQDYLIYGDAAIKGLDDKVCCCLCSMSSQPDAPN